MNVKVVVYGFLIPIASQALLMAAIGWLGINRHWNIEPLQAICFIITTAFGFAFVTNETSAKEKVLIALGYVPFMAIVAWVTGVLILLNLPGGEGNF
jgi:hypothetical protein